MVRKYFSAFTVKHNLEAKIEGNEWKKYLREDESDLSENGEKRRI